MPLELLPNDIKEILLKEKFSPSEKRGLSLVKSTDLSLYCPGISTGEVAELKFALQNAQRKIVATTIDPEGIREVIDYISKAGLDNQIQVKYEDVTERLEYPENAFDFIYARLLLHYLPKQKLDSTLVKLRRILRPQGKIFIVVRSTLDPDTKISGSRYEESTCLTTYPWKDENGVIHPEKPTSRYFHSQESISNHLVTAGFHIDSIGQYDEQLYLDFSRKTKSSVIANVIEIIASK